MSERTKNPWPENSDYGKLWRKGYEAGRSDMSRQIAEKMMRSARTESK